MEVLRLGDICDVVSGGTPSRANPMYWQDGTIPWIKISNIKEKYVNEADEFISLDGLNGSSAKMLKRGTILYTIFATLGEVGILDIDACTNQAIAGITIKHPEKILTDYLYYFLKSKKDYVNSIGRGVAQNNINMSTLRNFDVPVPSTYDQERIVGILGQTEKVITFRIDQLKTLDTLIKARFVEMFGDPEYNNKEWPIKKLNDLCSVGSSKRVYQEEQTTNGIPFWRISDLVAKMDSGNVESSLYIPESKFEELKTQGLVPEPGDILITSRGTLGRCYIVAIDDHFYFQDGMISWLSNYSDEIVPIYIQYLFDMPGFKKQIDGMQAGSTVAYLSIAMLKKLDVMLPGRELQDQFAAFVSQVDKSKAVVQAALVKTQLLFDSLMQQYFG